MKQTLDVKLMFHQLSLYLEKASEQLDGLSKKRRLIFIFKLLPSVLVSRRFFVHYSRQTAKFSGPVSRLSLNHFYGSKIPTNIKIHIEFAISRGENWCFNRHYCTKGCKAHDGLTIISQRQQFQKSCLDY